MNPLRSHPLYVDVQPPLTQVPEGDWFCDECDPEGTTKYLSAYIDKHNAAREGLDERKYAQWLEQLVCSEDILSSVWQRPHVFHSRNTSGSNRP
jgi:hypothetical protein